MGAGKGWTRPEFWPPVSSIVMAKGNRCIPDGSWIVIHLTRALVLDDDGNYSVLVSQLFTGLESTPTFEMFRSGRSDYSQAFRQVLPWMERTR